MKNIIEIFCLVFIVGCGTSRPDNTKDSIEEPNEDAIMEHVNKDDNFLDYLDEIPLVEFPMSYSCVDKLEGSLDIESKYRPEGSILIGKLNSIKNNHFIIYAYPADIILPILEVYSDDGIKIKEFELLDMGFCSFEFEDQISRYTILNDSAIVMENLKLSGSDATIVETKTILLTDL